VVGGEKITFYLIHIAFCANGVSNLVPLFGTMDFTAELDKMPFVDCYLGSSAYIFMTATVLLLVAHYPAHYLPIRIEDEEAVAQQKTTYSDTAMHVDLEKSVGPGLGQNDTGPIQLSEYPLQSANTKDMRVPIPMNSNRNCAPCSPIGLEAGTF